MKSSSLTQWLRQHVQALQTVTKRMKMQLLGTLMMFAMMGVTLCLPGILYVIVDNISHLANMVQDDPQISVFLKLDAKQDTVKSLEAKLKSHADIKDVHFENKDHAWQQLQLNAGSDSVASSLEKNPLPDAFFVKPAQLDPDAVERLVKEIQTWEGVELAQTDSNWIKRLDALLRLGQKAVWVLAGLLSFALIAIIGNSIRLQILTQREEIEVSQLIGATNRFIRRPFLYAGVIYGLGGGIAAWLMVLAVIQVFNLSVETLSRTYASDFSLNMPDWHVTFMMIAAAITLGWLGSFIAVNRSLSALKLDK